MGLTKHLTKLVAAFQLDSVALRWATKFAAGIANESNGDGKTNGEYAFIRRNCNWFQVVFDVGANKGDWSRYLLQACEEAHAVAPTVHAFEPSRATYELLTRNQFPANVHLVNAGLWSTPGTKRLHVFAQGAEGNSLYQREAFQSLPGTTMEAVEVTTVDDYCRQAGITRIDFLKIDAEGSELEVLRGAQQMFCEEKIQATQVEYGGTWIDARIFLRDLFQFVAGFPAYGLYKLYPNEARLLAGYTPELDNFRYANYIILRRGTPR